MDLESIVGVDLIYEKVLGYLNYNQKLKLRLVNKFIYKATNECLNRSINYMRKFNEQPVNTTVESLFRDLKVSGIDTRWQLFYLDRTLLSSITHLRIGDGVFGNGQFTFPDLFHACPKLESMELFLLYVDKQISFENDRSLTITPNLKHIGVLYNAKPWYELAVLEKRLNINDFCKFIKTQINLSVLSFEYTLFEGIYKCLIENNIKVETLKLSIDYSYIPLMNIAHHIGQVFEVGLYKRLEFTIPEKYVCNEEELKLLPGIKKIGILSQIEEWRKWGYPF